MVCDVDSPQQVCAIVDVDLQKHSRQIALDEGIPFCGNRYQKRCVLFGWLVVRSPLPTHSEDHQNAERPAVSVSKAWSTRYRAEPR